MKNHLYLLIILFSLISCYTYRSSSEKDETPPQQATQLPVKPERVAGESIAENQLNVSTIESKPNFDKNKTPRPKPASIEEKLEVNKYFKIEVGGRPYKIQVDKWESDTLVAHVIHKPKKILKFHKNQINQGTIAERRFSQPTADIITVVAYAAIGVGIYLLVK